MGKGIYSTPTPRGRTVDANVRRLVAQSSRKLMSSLGQGASRAVKTAFRVTPSRTATKTIVTLKRRGARVKQSTGMYVGNFSKPRRVKRSVYDLPMKKGHVATLELSKIQEGSNSVFIVHSTFASQLLFRSVCKSIVHEAFYSDGIQFTDWSGIPPTYDHKVEIFYRATEDGSASSSSSVAATGSTYSQIGDVLYSLINNTLFSNASAYIMRVQIYKKNLVGSDYEMFYKMNTENAIVHWIGSSHLKVQNRSITVSGEGADNQTTDVDNVPLTGTLLEGRGNGFRVKSSLSDIGFVTDRATATQSGSSGDISADYGAEPFMPAQLGQVKKFSKIILNPGRIKDSQLYSSGSITLSKFFLFLNVPDINADANTMVLQGKCRMLHFEKQIDVSSDNVRIAYENNYKYATYLTFSKSVTQPQYFQTVL